MAKQSLFKEFMLFVKEEKKYWMIPLVTVLIVVGLLMVFASSSPLAPFLYPLF
jgi:cell division protein FtsW (lipid II flippase)